jgi:hypothetical protein
VGEPAGLTDIPGEVQVVVAGGGPVGLACAVELGRRGIGCLVVEPRTTVSHARPRCKTINVRSMQHLLLADNLDAGDAGGERARRAAAERIQQAKRPEFHSLDLVLGARIEGSPVIAGGPGAGTLLPHAWLGPGRSLYDELGAGFTLLVCRPGAGGGLIEKAARAASTSTWRGPATASPLTAWP